MVKTLHVIIDLSLIEILTLLLLYNCDLVLEVLLDRFIVVKAFYSLITVRNFRFKIYGLFFYALEGIFEHF